MFRHATLNALQAAGVPASPSYSASGLVTDEHLLARGFFQPAPDAPGGTAMRSVPSWRLWPATPVRYGAAPGMGKHTEEVLAAVLDGDAEKVLYRQGAHPTTASSAVRKADA